jgi:hypothetical protein
MLEHITDEDSELLEGLGVETASEVSGGHSAKEQRIIAGFEEIVRFIEEHGRLPQHGEGRDTFERIYAVRLDQIRASSECREALKDQDSHGLLVAGDYLNGELTYEVLSDKELTEEELLASLGAEPSLGHDITELVHVRSHEEIKAAEEIAQRTPCKDFDNFKPIFEAVQRELESGHRRTAKYRDNAEINSGDLFILEGQKLIVAEMGNAFISDYGRPDWRLRVVYDNATESDLLMRSLQRALNRDTASRRISVPGLGPLFSDEEDADDSKSGFIYVLRSESTHPFVVENRLVLHKIGVTGGEVKKRVANAKHDPTYLLADVEIVATYKLANLNRQAFETLLHKCLSSARLDLELQDRFGASVEPREWFLVPLNIIHEVIQKIKDETIGDFRYDPETARLTNIR